MILDITSRLNSIFKALAKTENGRTLSIYFNCLLKSWRHVRIQKSEVTIKFMSKCFCKLKKYYKCLDFLVTNVTLDVPIAEIINPLSPTVTHDQHLWRFIVRIL
uniref:Uncharacterized protein n=1 Tax=Cacopsylla melanoneura TaxID=428564 RepID=A0A8D9BUU3_9HEMI